MEGLSRSEYPGILANLQPPQAVSALQDRVRRINKLNDDIADWLLERRKVEEAYVQGLRRLLSPKTPGPSSDQLGVFQTPWDKILHSTDGIAASHHLYASRIEKDVETPLRNFVHKKEMANMQTIGSNLNLMSKELDEAREKAEKLSKKGGKANAQKVDAASAKLDSATEKWESQAPFIFESLQDVDEMRVNHLRDVLTQLLTHEVDQAGRSQAAAEEALNTMLEIDTSQEIREFVSKTTAGRPKIEPRRTGTGISATTGAGQSQQTSTLSQTRSQSESAASAPPPSRSQPNSRQQSFAGASSLAPPPSLPATQQQEDSFNDQTSADNEKSEKSGSKLRSRFGTMLGRRRQSLHGGFSAISPIKEKRSTGNRLGGLSPRASTTNLGETSGRLSSLAEAESPTSERARASNDVGKDSHDGTNGVKSGGDAAGGGGLQKTPSNLLNGTPEDIFDAPPPPGPPPGHKPLAPTLPAAQTDADGFTVPPARSDPISEAQREAAAEESDQLFSLKIANKPVVEEDAAEKQAALSNVANALGQMSVPSRRGGTVRGRRDVRNTIYIPAGLPVGESTSSVTGSVAGSGSALSPGATSPPSLGGSTPKLSTVAQLASEGSLAGSDSQSVRSGVSLSSLAHLRHPELTGPGLSSSVIESVSATFEDGVVTSAKVNGEIAFAYVGDEEHSSSHEKIRINNFPFLESIGPNRIFVSATDASKPDEFTLDTSHLTRTSPAFTYRVHADEDSPPSLAKHVPLLLKPAWKPTGDKLGLLLQYRLNDSWTGPRPVTLQNVVFVATYESAIPAAGAQTKPSGTHLKDKKLVYWRMGDVTLAGGEWGKIVCRIVGAENGEVKPGNVEARWEYAVPAGGVRTEGIEGEGISVSRWVESKGKGKEEAEDDPFADDGAPAKESAAGSWVDVSLVKKLVSGKYEAR